MAENPLAQFEVSPIFSLPQLAGVNLSITNSSLVMLIAVVAITLFFTQSMRKQLMVPGRLQSVAELTYEFVHGIVDENVGHGGKKFFPFVFTLFMFILLMNLLGLFPYSFAPTSHIIITLGMGAFVFIAITIIGLIKQGLIGFFKHFIPDGLPLWLIPVIFVIELVSYCARPLSLSLRLAISMMAGHTLMYVIAMFVVPLGVLFAFLPIAFLVFMTGLEIFVAILQAYVFALMSCMYLSEALADHH